MVFHGPDLETFREKLRTKELDMFVSERYLVTIHEERDERRSRRSLSRAAGRRRAACSTAASTCCCYNILDHMVDHYQPILDYLQDAAGRAGGAGADRAHARACCRRSRCKKRELLNLRRIVGPQREVLAQLTRGDVPFIREATRIYLRDVQDHLIRAVEMVELYRDLVLGARDIYLSSISNNLNQHHEDADDHHGDRAADDGDHQLLRDELQRGADPSRGAGSSTHPAGFWLSMGMILALIAGLLYLFRRNKWI